MTRLFDTLPRVPRHCFWEITEQCNLRCIHCEQDAGRRAADELSTQQALDTCDMLKAAGCNQVHLTGGEPLTRKDWPLIAARIADLGMKPALITNGVLVDEQSIETMMESGIVTVSISIDGDEAVHDAIRVGPKGTCVSSYQRAVNALRLVAGSPIKSAAITQIHQQNLDDLPGMHDLLVRLGVDTWQVQICMPLGRLMQLKREYLIKAADLPKLIRILAALKRRDEMAIAVADNIGYFTKEEPLLRGTRTRPAGFWTGCSAGCSTVAICSNGDVKGCPSHPKSFVVGNLTKEPFRDIWRDEARFEYNTRFREALLQGQCRACAYRRICRGGCTTMAYALTGTIYDNPFCAQQTAEPCITR